MKTNFLTLLLMICFGLSLSYCIKDTYNMVGKDPAPPGTYPNVDEELWPYFQRFENEAAIRHIDVELNNAGIIGIISDIPTDHVQGLCSHNSSDPNKLTVDRPFWNKAFDPSREFVVFHELGHCFLGRSHEEGKDSQGFCLSIMRSGAEDCIDNYTSITRKKYLDELFIKN